MVLNRYITILIQGDIDVFYLGTSRLGQGALGTSVQNYCLTNDKSVLNFILGKSKLGVAKLGINQSDLFGITSGSLNLEQILCDNELTFGQMCASKFEVECFNLNVDVTGFKIEVYVTENEITKKLFSGIIDSSTTDNLGGYRDIIAYDDIYYKRALNVAEWWENYWEGKSKLTIKQLRESLCSYVEIPYSTDTLINDDLLVPQYNHFTSVTFNTLMTMLCEVSACFPHINNDGILEFITLNTELTTVPNYEKVNSTFEDYTTDTITGVAIFNSSNEFVKVRGEEGNTYNISNNIFLLSLSDSELNNALDNIYNSIKDINYTPCSIPLVISDLNIKLGSYFSTNKGNHYVMSQIFSGSLFVEQTINCVAYSKELNKSVNDLNNDIIQGKKYSSISQTIEQIKFEISDVQTNIIDLQKQVDGAISTWYYEGEPTLTNIPASEWVTEEDKVMHIGDLYYDKLTGYAYRFMKDESTYTWVRISDEDITKALESAQNAQETADGKRTIYYSSIEPTGTFEIGDLWVNGSMIKVWNSSEWVSADDYAQNSYVNELVNAINISIKETNDIVTKNTENISKLTQTSEAIKSEVSSLQTTISNLSSDIQEQLKNYSTIEQTSNSINLAVSSMQTTIMNSVADTYATKASLSVYVTEDDAKNSIASWINACADNIVLNASSKLVFGDLDNQYITISNYSDANGNKVGVLFDGTGQIIMTPEGKLDISNYVSGNLYNQFQMKYDSSGKQIYLWNKKFADTNNGNSLSLWTTVNTNAFNVSNYDLDTTYVANRLNMYSQKGENYSSNYAIIMNNKLGTSKFANVIQMLARYSSSSTTYNSIDLINYDMANDTYANTISLSSYSTGNNLFIGNRGTYTNGASTITDFLNKIACIVNKNNSKNIISIVNSPYDGVGKNGNVIELNSTNISGSGSREVKIYNYNNDDPTYISNSIYMYKQDTTNYISMSCNSAGHTMANITMSTFNDMVISTTDRTNHTHGILICAYDVNGSSKSNISISDKINLYGTVCINGIQLYLENGYVKYR